MAQEYLPIVGIAGGLSAYIVGPEYGLSGPVLLAVVIASAMAMIAVWWYSPMPNRSIFVVDGRAMGDHEAGYWGFKRDDD